MQALRSASTTTSTTTSTTDGVRVYNNYTTGVKFTSATTTTGGEEQLSTRLP